MTREDIDRAVETESGAASGEGRLSCARALGIARRLGVDAGEVGSAANRLDVRIVDCQLGCFGSRKPTPDDVEGTHVSPALADGIATSLVEGRLPCPAAFEVARKAKVSPADVGKAATKQQIKISGCQLGCFP